MLDGVTRPLVSRVRSISACTTTPVPVSAVAVAVAVVGRLPARKVTIFLRAPPEVHNSPTPTSRSTARTPILNEIAQYSRSMAPQVYQWGMEQFNKNQGNIDAMMRNALTYGSAQRVASEMGKAQAGVMKGAEAGRQNAIRDLQSYGIDPSSGRYAALDKANQVMAGAAAAGAGNMQRDVVQKTAGELQNQAMQLSNQNVHTGYGASNAMNQLLGTGMQLKYSPLGTKSSGTSTGQNTAGGVNQSFGGPAQYVPGATPGSPGSWSMPTFTGGGTGFGQYGQQGISNTQMFAEGGDVDMDTGMDGEATAGGFVSHELSPSSGATTDDVQARLNAGEFVIPKDVSAWLGQEYFYKLMAKARAARATAGQENGDNNAMPTTGYGADQYAQA